MLHTFETRLNLPPELAALLAVNSERWSWGARKAWSLLYRQNLTRTTAYATLTREGFTSHQVDSMLTQAEMRHAGLVELKKYERGQLELAIQRRERALADKGKKIQALSKRQAKLRAQRNKVAPKPGKARSNRYLTTLARLREVDTELEFCRNWVAQKERVLTAKRGKLSSLLKAMDEGRYSLCFGSKKLLQQRPGEHNTETTPFASVEDWHEAWDTARNGQVWSIGRTAKPSGNSELQWLPDTNQLRVRLTDKLAHERMDALGIPRSGGPQKVMPLRMKCRFIVIDGVDFASHRGAARAALIDAFGKRPVTMRLLQRLSPAGERIWYLQASVDVPTGFNLETARTREAGVLGLDLNARGVAWAVVKPDGNRLREGHPRSGFLGWDLKGLSDAVRKQVIGTTVAELARLGKRLGLAVAIENLDFATKKAGLRAGGINKRYNEMLSTFASSQFAELMTRACEKAHVRLYLVNPSYSSVGGFTKYGRPNRIGADESAALWLGRQALYGIPWKTVGAQCFVKRHNERLVFSHLPATPKQSKTALAGAQWKDVARALGKNRQRWGENLRNWFLCQVETPSPQTVCEPGVASLATG